MEANNEARSAQHAIVPRNMWIDTDRPFRQFIPLQRVAGHESPASGKQGEGIGIMRGGL